MNFSDSKKKLALAGALCGVIAAVLAILVIRQIWQSVLPVLFETQQVH